MAFKNPLNHWRGPELKEPLFKSRALLGKEVRKVLLAHPDGLTSMELNEILPGGGGALHFLRKAGFARLLTWNAKENVRRHDIWFASEPKSDPQV